jgi:hypothetical protein
MFTISRNSWHYRFANLHDAWASEQTNLCPYIRTVLKGMALFTFLWTLLVTFVGLNLLGIADAFNGIWFRGDGVSIFGAVNVITTLIIAGLGVIALLTELRERYDRYKYKQYIKMREQTEAPDYVPPQPGFIALWWASLHDKLCPGIEIK